MTLEGFEYEAFAKNLAEQAKTVIPDDISEEGRTYIINLVYNYCTLSGEALHNDEQSGLSVDEATIVCQFIGEWTFHKSIDIIRANLPLELRDETMQRIAFTVFDVAKLSLQKKIPLPQVIENVERHVKKTYDETIASLQQTGRIDEKQAQNAASQSNLDRMTQEQEQAEQRQRAEQEAVQRQQVQEAQQKKVSQNKQQESKILKLASLALLLQKISKQKRIQILQRLSSQDAEMVVKYINMKDLHKKLDSTVALKCLREIKKSIPKIQMSDEQQIFKKIKTIVKNSSAEKISAIINGERQNIKNVVTEQKEGIDTDLPPKIAAVVCRYLEEKIKR